MGTAENVWISTLVGELQRALARLVTTESRIAASLALLVGAVVVGTVLTPRLVGWTERAAKGLSDRQDRLPVPDRDLGWLLPTWLAVRSLQLVVVLSAGVATLLLWGYVDAATYVVDGVLAAVPVVGRAGATVGLLVAAVVGTDVLESRLATYADGSERFNEHQEGMAFRVLQLVLLVAVGMGVLTVWSFDVGGLLVGAGFLGIVVGMAARQTLGSLIAGFVLMFSQPFKLGDWVEIGGHEGVVTDITIVNTRLWSFDGETVVLPNDVVSNSTVRNRTERGRLRLSVPVGVDYDTDLDRAESVVESALADVDTVLDVPTPQVVPQSFDDSAIELDVRVWIDNPSGRRRWQTRAAVIRALKRAFDREGIDIPFPQRVVSEREKSAGPPPREEREAARSSTADD